MAAGGGVVADPLSPAGVPCAFSPQSQAYFALASADGHLRVWETANNRLHQEYVPSAHLSGTCTCLAWAPARLQAKVKQEGRRGAGICPGLASASPRPDGAWPDIARGPRRPRAMRHGMRRRCGVGPCCQPRARPVHRAARECSAQTDWWWAGVVSAGSMRSLLRAPFLLVPPCSRRPGFPRGSYLLLGFAHALFRSHGF